MMVDDLVYWSFVFFLVLVVVSFYFPTMNEDEKKCLTTISYDRIYNKYKYTLYK